MPRTRAQRQRETVEGGWAELPEELVEKVLELLQAAGRSEPQDSFGLSQATATVRLVCAGWKAVHDAMVTRLLLSWQTTDAAMGKLVRSFPAVVSLEVKLVPGEWAVLTDEGMRAVSGLPKLTSLNISCCKLVTDAGMRAVSRLPALTFLDFAGCQLVTDEGVRAVSGLPKLTSLNISFCKEVSDEGMLAVSSMPALISLELHCCDKVTDEGVRAVSSMPALTSLDLTMCDKVTNVGLRELRRLTTLTELYGSRTSKAGRDALKAAIPGLVISPA
jgi:hypothetical protein